MPVQRLIWESYRLRLSRRVWPCATTDRPTYFCPGGQGLRMHLRMRAPRLMTQLRIAFGILGSFPQVWVDTLKVRLLFCAGKRLAEAVPATRQRHVADNITMISNRPTSMCPTRISSALSKKNQSCLFPVLRSIRSDETSSRSWSDAMSVARTSWRSTYRGRM